MLKKILATLLCAFAMSFAAGADSASVRENLEQVPVDVMQEEIALRDSVMQVRDSLCAVEKDSLRRSIVVEEAKCANWEQSYETVKKGNEVCAQALSVAIETNEKNKEKAAEEKKKTAMMSSSSFFGGVGVGLLIMWLIMK